LEVNTAADALNVMAASTISETVRFFAVFSGIGFRTVGGEVCQP
jgi:hypothetical protein